MRELVEYDDADEVLSRSGGERSTVDRDVYPAPRWRARALTIVARTRDGVEEVGRTVVSLR
jgi:hypothetical protein